MFVHNSIFGKPNSEHICGVFVKKTC